MRVYQSASGQWIVWTGSEKLYFNTALEAMTMITKTRFVEALQVQATVLAGLGTVLGDLTKVYMDRRYGNHNAIEATDIESLGLTVEQVGAMINLVPILLVLLDNETNRATINNMRTDV